MKIILKNSAANAAIILFFQLVVSFETFHYLDCRNLLVLEHAIFECNLELASHIHHNGVSESISPYLFPLVLKNLLFSLFRWLFSSEATWLVWSVSLLPDAPSKS